MLRLRAARGLFLIVVVRFFSASLHTARIRSYPFICARNPFPCLVWPPAWPRTSPTRVAPCSFSSAYFTRPRVSRKPVSCRVRNRRVGLGAHNQRGPSSHVQTARVCAPAFVDLRDHRRIILSTLAYFARCESILVSAFSTLVRPLLSAVPFVSTVLSRSPVFLGALALKARLGPIQSARMNFTTSTYTNSPRPTARDSYMPQRIFNSRQPPPLLRAGRRVAIGMSLSGCTASAGNSGENRRDRKLAAASSPANR